MGLNIINYSFDKKNKDKIFVCDFNYRGHCVQLLISKGKVIAISTGKKGSDLVAEIKTRFIENFPKKAKQIRITNLYIEKEITSACTITPETDVIQFLLKIEKHNKKRKRLIELNKKLIEIVEKKEKGKKYDENKYQELIEKNKELTKNEMIIEKNKKLTKNKMIFLSPKDITNKTKEELKKEIKIAQSEIIKQSKITKYLNDIDLFVKGKKKFEELQKEHFIFSKERIETLVSVHENHSKHFNNINKKVENIKSTIPRIPNKEEIKDKDIKEQESNLKKTIEDMNKQLEQSEKQLSGQ